MKGLPNRSMGNKVSLLTVTLGSNDGIRNNLYSMRELNQQLKKTHVNAKQRSDSTDVWNRENLLSISSCRTAFPLARRKKSHTVPMLRDPFMLTNIIDGIYDIIEIMQLGRLGNA